MITKVRIQNFKSVEDLTIELGQVNVIIGANGTGKSNILEGIAMGAAAGNNVLLSYEHITNRIRATDHQGLISGFGNNVSNSILLSIKFEEFPFQLYLELAPFGQNGRSWTPKYYVEDPFPSELLISDPELLEGFQVLLKKSNDRPREKEDLLEMLKSSLLSRYIRKSDFSNFLIFAPENTYLRKFEEPGQITPLGLRGEGLFYELKQIFTRPEKADQLAEIKEHLELFEWYEDIELPNGLLSMEYRLSIKDRYRAEGLDALDQRSANEGFLFWLFYLVLFTSEHTPRFFAIDNIETAFNPLLCTEIITRLTQLAKKHNKQVIFTTHNPAILDGIDLKDDQQRLFVTSRGNKGQTRIRRIDQKPKEGIKLSELWMKGYIGGIPSNF